MHTLALLIDGDNVQLKYVEQILRFCEIHGSLKIKHAYGDWTQLPLSAHRETLTELGLKCVQQNRVGKNATDFKLAMDIARMLEKHKADIYFLASSDGDFTAVCNEIRQNGAKVIGIGTNGVASTALQNACTLYFDAEDIVKSRLEAPAKLSAAPKPTPKAAPKLTLNVEAKPKAAPKPTPKVEVKTKAAPKLTLNVEAKPKAAPKPTPKAEAKPKAAPKPTPIVKVKPQTPPKPAPPLEMLLEACQKATQDNGWAHLGQIGHALRQLDGQFEQRFASKKLLTRFKEFPQKFEISKDYVRIIQID